MSLFSKVPIKRPKRTVFDLSHERKFSCNMGQLIPILVQDVVPGDSFRLNTEVMMRLAPMLAPIMHRVNVYTHYFFVPNRLLWNEWEDFITGGPDGQANPVFPRFMWSEEDDPTGSYLAPGTLADYMGLNQPDSAFSGSNLLYVSQLPFRAYKFIYNEYYRDQNLETLIEHPRDSGIDPVNASLFTSLMSIRNRAWEKDYFTSALPWTQRGGDVQIPITGDADVLYRPDGEGGAIRDVVTGAQWPASGSDPVLAYDDSVPGGIGTGGGVGMAYDPQGSLYADMSSISASTINELRQAFQLQKWLERNARSGSRYIEQILSHFGVKSSDSRLQRPEYLGGGKSPVMISEVLQTSSTDTTSPLAEMAGHGISVGNTHQFQRFFEEHGVVMGIMSVLPKTAYQQGIPKQFSKFDKFDYFWPEFANLGEQEIKKQELYVSGTNAYNESVFGYTPRYSEYKYMPSSVHGDFKYSLAFWHMGRIFSAAPSLNSGFVTSNPTQRIFAVEDPESHKLWVQVYNNVKAIRPMPYFGTPGGI